MSSILANGLMHSNVTISSINGNNSSMNTVNSNLQLNSNSCITSNANQLVSNVNHFNNIVNREMKENLIFTAVNQMTSNQINKQGLINSSNTNIGFIQPAQQVAASNLLQNSNNSHTNTNLTQFQQNFHQNQIAVTNLRYKNSNLNGSVLNSNNQTIYRSFNGSNCKHQLSSQYQLLNTHLINNGTINSIATNNNTGNILLNISNRNNYNNNHFNYFNQHSNGNTNSNIFNSYQLNYHVHQTGNLVNHHNHHINSLSSSPRSSSSSNSSTSSSIMNYHTTNNCSNKYQNGQYSPSSSVSPTILSTENHYSNNSNHASTLNKLNVTLKSKNVSNGNNYHHYHANNQALPTTSSSNQQPQKPQKQQQQTQQTQQTQQQQQQQQTQQQQNGNNSTRYKTELCRPFEESGFCKYSDKCQYAHGQNELRSLQRHPKYKTELCRTFHTTGFCPYGPRCHFIHNNDGNVFTKKDKLIMDQFNSNSNISSRTVNNAVSISVNENQNEPISKNHSLNSTIDIDSTSANSPNSILGGSLSLTNSSELSPQQSMFENVISDNISVSFKQNTLNLKINNIQHELNLELSSNFINNKNTQLSPSKKTASLLNNSSSTSSISLNAGSSSGNTSPFQQHLSSLSSKTSDDVFYKYL